MKNQINQPATKQQKRKKSNEIRVVCCFSNELLATHDPEKVSYVHYGKEVIGFKYSYFRDITLKGKTYFPVLPKTKPRNFDILEYLNNTRDILNDPKRNDGKRKQNTLRKITLFLDKTRLSRYIGGTAEFVRFGLKPTAQITEPEIIPKKFREKAKK